MNDFNAILGKMKSWANAAGKKTEEVVETSKLKLQIVSLNGDISKAYEELGALVYHAAKNNETVGEEMDAVMEKIDELLVKLAELESKVTEIKKERICGNCGAACPVDAHFCSRCGVILEAMEEDEAEEAEESCAELCADEDCCGNCRCTGDCATCDDGSNKACDHDCEHCDCCEEEGCECDCQSCCCNKAVEPEAEETEETACCCGSCEGCSSCEGCGCGCDCDEAEEKEPKAE